ncbi:MAG: class I SAM-dependent methyltransferase [Desulfosporosinus sp.]|nr:class I SAM-dependent methyltransferase [Desulfosporosinus sp.]
MANSQLTVVEVMERIQEAMKAKKTLVFPEMVGSVNHESNEAGDNELNSLDAELRQNNLKWNVNIDFPITSHRKTIGHFIVFGKKLMRKFLRWYVNPSMEQQREFNGSVTRSINILSNYAHKQSKALQDFEAILNGVNTQFKELSSAGAGVGTLTDELQAKADRNDVDLLKEYLAGKAGAEELEAMKGHLASKVDESKLEAIRDMLAKKADRAELDDVRMAESAGRSEVLALVDEQTKRCLESELTLIADRLRRLERKINKGLHLEPGVRTVERLVREDKEENLDIDYFLFERRFRGSREDIKERQRVYLDYFRGKNKVLDIGCGRGEFVELLMENGVGVQGIDLNEDMVGYCQDRGLPVIQADLFTCLEGQDDNSLDGIIAAQVIEHLRPFELLRFIDLCLLKSRGGGVIVLETINTQNPIAVSNWFYADITHVRPVHPETLKFIMDSKGFKNSNLRFLNTPEKDLLSGLKIEAYEKELIEFNSGIRRINELLNGPQDYAIIAYK